MRISNSRTVFRSIYAAGLAVLVSAVALVTTGIWPAQAQIAGGFDFTRPQVVATGLVAPWGTAFLPDGSLLVSERDSARLLQIRTGQAPQVLGNVPGVVPGGEGGLLGLAVSPTYAQDQWVYAYFTAASDNRIVRFRLNAISTQQVIVSGLTKASIHNGGRIAFGPDGMLYAGVGDAGNTSNSQNTNSRNGKILRMTPTGGTPAGNPFNSLVYSLGHRNVQGLGWDSQGRLYATEFGQNTWDEVNQIVAGGNYGWPTCEGMCNNPSFRNPIVVWTTAESSPSGAAVANNHVFAAALRGQRLWVVPLTASGGAGTPIDELNNQFGRLRSVILGPDGWLWVATSNRDGRGSPTAQDDRIVRFPPAGQQPSPTASLPRTTSPTASPPPSPSVSPLPPGGCAATYQVVNAWPGNFQANVTVRNNGTSATNSWTVTWAFPNGQVISQLWGGDWTQVGPNVTVRNAPWNGVIQPGASITFGFIASAPATNGNPNPVNCTRT
ncbi:MAG TPA: PQQ-dependent sugar dehydrogenase [Candidatus Limnocylindrales bacterium]